MERVLDWLYSVASTAVVATVMSIGDLAGPARAAQAAEDGARAALGVLCAGCHRRAGAGEAPSALDLDRLARERALVQPGNPEGSLLLTRLLRHEAPHGEPSGGLPRAPTPPELLAIRAWIAQLPVNAAACDPQRRPALDGLDRGVNTLARRLRRDPRLLRVITMAHLDTTCRDAEQLASWRKSLSLLLGALAGRGKGADLIALDDRGAVFALDLKALDWDDARWRVVVGTQATTVRADWLVARVSRGALGDALAGPRKADGGAIARMAAMLRLVAIPPDAERAARGLGALIRAHDATIDLRRAAAEMDVSPQRLVEHAETAGAEVRRLVVRLAQGGIPRGELEPLLPALATELRARSALGPTTPEPRPASVPLTPTVSVHTDKLAYRMGDAIEFEVRSSADCHLTVISVDTRGRGTVIFPNDLAPRNVLRAGETQRIPGDGAGYRLRFSKPGREGLVAICAAGDVPPDGITHDFERQRFQELGDYALFLERAWTGLGDAAGGPAVSGARGRNAASQLAPADVWRTGVVVEIK